jgi:site-specific DNA-methyltransferase (adenine-specific)
VIIKKYSGIVSEIIIPLPFPDKKYNIIYADPAWSYNDKMKGKCFGADFHYETQGTQWIRSLPVNNICEKDSVLFMWAVSPLLPDAIDVINKWGFKYKTVAFCWSKLTKNKKRVSNLGRWTMGNIEICLLATKGKPKRIIKNVKQFIECERTQHSKKPDEVRERIVELMGDLPRIELFARQKVEGWDCWGDEVN